MRFALLYTFEDGRVAADYDKQALCLRKTMVSCGWINCREHRGTYEELNVTHTSAVSRAPELQDESS